MTIKEMRTAANMTQKAFAEYFHIPKRSIENWEGEKSKCPEYVRELIEYKLKKEIALNPVNVKYFDCEISNADCPSCGHGMPDMGGISESYQEVEQYDFCPWCGQKLRWDNLNLEVKNDCI